MRAFGQRLVDSGYCHPDVVPVELPAMTKAIAVGCLMAAFLAVSSRNASAQG
jgi:hypothetical protein